jgi:S-adenosylmethionine:tRNA ribosyltransferase-isomerase
LVTQAHGLLRHWQEAGSRAIVRRAMKASELEYDLPSGLIAQHPSQQRDQARLMVLDRARGSVRLDVFANLPAYLDKGDCLVANDTRVIRARLHGRKATGGHVEVFLLREKGPGVWDALVRPSARVKPGTVVTIADAVKAEVGEVLEKGQRRVRFDRDDVVSMLEEIGEIPLPPYVTRPHPDDEDAVRYQTIYAKAPGAVAAPTAGLHYTDAVFAALEAKGVRRANLTLHVGYGTFKPIECDHLADHMVDAEEFDFSQAAANELNRTRDEGGRVVAVGTTVTRVLETRLVNGVFEAGGGVTDLFIYPPYGFKAIDVLQTNFHLPRSSLLALVCAFAGTDFVLGAYRRAIEERFRFYSYGDTMLIV